MIWGLLGVFLFVSVSGQATLSGVVNHYAEVTAIDTLNQKITVASASAFASGDKVLLIQMQGATINSTQSNSFGHISAYNNAGNYEFHRVCTVQGNDVTVSHPLVNNYTPSGKVQLIRVPRYQDAVLNGDLSGKAWDGTTGGVLAIDVDGVLDLDTHNIDLSAGGFRGGQAVTSGGGCTFIVDVSYYTSINSTNEKGRKGEGIAAFVAGRECGRGPQANGGGGGNNHNGGGSGGANYGSGGQAGQRVKATTFSCGSTAGLGSKALSFGYTMGKLFLGGGGGAGHGNNVGTTGEGGSNGGGLIFIIADTVLGNDRNIRADGGSGVNATNEGGGGGGAGGTVVLDAEHIDSTLNISTDGGVGSSTNNTGSSNCNGPGGGGGGGMIYLTMVGIPMNVNTSTDGGFPGAIASTAQTNCNLGSSNVGQGGRSGAVRSSYSFNDLYDVLPVDSLTEVGCDSLVSPSGKYTWYENGSYLDTVTGANGCPRVQAIALSIERLDSNVLQSGATLTAVASGVAYRWLDCDNDYTLVANSTALNQQFVATENGRYAVAITRNGCTDTSACYLVDVLGLVPPQSDPQVQLYPNPTNGRIHLVLDRKVPALQVNVFDLSGRKLESHDAKGVQQFSWDLSISSGVYLIEVEEGNWSRVFRIIVR